MRLPFVLAGFLLVLVLPAAAQAASPLTIIKDCMQEGRLDGDYSNEDLRRAKGQLSGDQLEYYDCAEVINAAINNPDAPGAGGDGGGETSGGAPAPEGTTTPADDVLALKDATGEAAKDPVPRGPRAAAAGDGPLVGAASDPPNGPPAPVLALLVAATLIGLAAGVLKGLRTTSQPPDR